MYERTTFTANSGLILFLNLRAQPWALKSLVVVLNKVGVRSVIKAVQESSIVRCLSACLFAYTEQAFLFCYSDSLLLYGEQAPLAGFEIIFRFDAG